MENPFYSYSTYLKKRWGMSVYRVGVDAGFSCPNRETGGCTYCDSHGARAVWLRNDSHGRIVGMVDADRFKLIGEQIGAGVEFLTRRYKAGGFILYFQANTNTYGTPDELKSIYDYALTREDFCEIAVSTRPDCLSSEIITLLSSYKTETRDVWVELGLQTGNNTTLQSINRGHTKEEFISAFQNLRDAGIKIIVHLILGLPGEETDDFDKTLKLVNGLKPEGVKFHNLHIPEDTRMFEEYLHGEITAPSYPRHLDSLIFALERISADIIVLRMTCDTPGGPGAPRYFGDKTQLFLALKEKMGRLNTWQGRLADE